MRMVLVGAVESSAVAFDVLRRSSHVIDLVVTLPEGRLQRHSDARDLTKVAAPLEVSVHQTSNINDPKTLAAIEEHEPDFVFVIGWSQICGPGLLDIPRVGTIGYHPAPLPRNRGRAVIPWTILQEEYETASTLFWMDEGMDSGDIAFQARFPLDSRENAGTLYAKHMERLREMLEALTGRLPDLGLPRMPQNEGAATYCGQRLREDGLIDWTAPADEIDRLIRASTSPYPGAFTKFGEEDLIIWSSELPGSMPYVGVPGQVQMIDDSGALVQCGRGSHLLVSRVEMSTHDRPVESKSILRRHSRLGR